MPVTVSLSEVLDVLMSQNETSCAFVNRETGEILACTEEGIRTAEAHQDEAAPQWMQEQLPKIRKALQGDPWLELPSKFDIHEWEIMGRRTTPDHPGPRTLISRARNAAGASQPDKHDERYGSYVANHTLPIEVVVQ
jgi:hypothetical protein